MLQVEEILSLEYYKKTSFTGSQGNMRFKIEKEENDDGKFLKVWHWAGPYAFPFVEDDKKVSKMYPFESESLGDIVAYLNEATEQYK